MQTHELEAEIAGRNGVPFKAITVGKFWRHHDIDHLKSPAVAWKKANFLAGSTR